MTVVSTESSLYNKFRSINIVHSGTIQECLCGYTMNDISIQYVIGTILIPLCEFVIYPLFYQCLPNLKSYWKFILGTVLCLGVNVSHNALFTYARHQYLMNTTFSHENVTLQCLFQERSGSLSNVLDYRWFFIVNFFSTLSALLMGIGAIEFFCAQTPYSMKGLVIGIVYGLLILFALLEIILPTFLLTTIVHWPTGTISCTFWYLLTKFILCLLAITTLLLVMRWYKNRKRDDVLPKLMSTSLLRDTIRPYKLLINKILNKITFKFCVIEAN